MLWPLKSLMFANHNFGNSKQGSAAAQITRRLGRVKNRSLIILSYQSTRNLQEIHLSVQYGGPLLHPPIVASAHNRTIKHQY